MGTGIGLTPARDLTARDFAPPGDTHAGRRSPARTIRLAAVFRLLIALAPFDHAATW
ncbi:hypothetical protein [Streptomyces gibsoniae]|uniref:Uncharacterized protein n=1 Tax=Streptomyces gibsoniae TaxID=3075529 RepID=A0ABU2U8T3_9ACTN|nr:hypothetical protein [Streptomyces sp. DSM 41699]MDT0469638.1 hypothetical protein [Streptomyces sp. DSM 41699]